MMHVYALILLVLAAGTKAHARRLAAPTPTQALAQAAHAQGAGSSHPRLGAPCWTPSQFYPYQTCSLNTNATQCGRGFSAWPTKEQCCAVQHGNVGAFPGGCTDFNTSLSCWAAATYFPSQACALTSNFSVCSRNWGHWPSQEACCRRGAGFENGCTQPGPCYTAVAYYPSTQCGLTTDQAVCGRGWGAFPDMDSCCTPGTGAFSTGCGSVAGANAGADGTPVD